MGGSKSKIFAVKTAMNREEETADLIQGQDDYNGLSLKAILVSPTIGGYVFVEADDVAEVLRATENVRLARKVLETPASEEDIDRIMTLRPQVAKVSYGAAVLITDGDFKGEEGKIENITHAEGVATVKLSTTVVPVSVTVNLEQVTPVKKGRSQQ